MVNNKIGENEIKTELELQYNFKIIKLCKNSESTVGNVYNIETKNNKYIAKIYDDIVHTKAMIKIHTLLLSKGLNVPSIIKTVDNKEFIKFNNKYNCVIYSFLQGEQISSSKIIIDNKLITLIAKEMRKLHNATRDEKYNEIPPVPFSCSDNARRSILHFDLTKDNILINKGKIEFIDFDDAKYGPSVVDVAIAVAILFFSKKKGVDMQGLNQFIGEYYGKDTDLKNEEISLIKDYAVKWIDFTLHENQFNQSTTESFEVKRKLIKQYL